MSFIFGGNTGETAESIRRKRAVAAAMQQQAAPRDLGSGLTYASGKIASALIERKARDEQKKGEDAWRSQWGDYLGGQQGTPFLTPEQASAPVAPVDVQPLGFVDPIGPEAVSAAIKPSGFEAAKPGIFAGESGGDYDALYGYSQREGKPFAGTKLTEMTVDEALAFADPNGPYGQFVAAQNNGTVATPMGAYQVVGRTLGDAKKGLGLTGSEVMTPELQDRIGEWIYNTQGIGAWEGYRPDAAGTPPSAVPAVATALTSAPQPSPRGPMGLDPRLLALASNDFMPENMRPIVTALLQQEMARNAPPEALTPYQQETLDLRRRELDARLSGRINDAPVVNVDARGPAPDKFAERTGTVLADEAAEVAKAGAAASANLRAVDRLEGLLSRAPTGGMAAFQQMLGEFGIETQGLSEIQAAQALINKLVPEQRAPGTGPMSDADLALFKQSMPRIINTPEGNRLIIETLRKIAEYDIQRGQIARELQLGRMTYEQAIDAWGALANPLEGFKTPDAAPSGRNATRLRFNPETGELE